MAKTGDRLYDYLSRYEDAVYRDLELSAKLYRVGAKSIDELFPIHHYYIHKDVFYEELLYVAHMNKFDSPDYELVDNTDWHHSYPYGIRRDPETGEPVKLVELSIFEGRLNKKAGGDISVWYHDTPNNAKKVLAEYYSKRHKQASKQVARFEDILKQLQ